MTGFDIKTLLHFQPPQYQCEKCLALYKRDTVPGRKWGEKEPPQCGVCEVQYTPADFKSSQVAAYLTSRGYEIKIQDLVPHTRQLARIVADMNTGCYTGEFPDFVPFVPFRNYSAFEALLEAIRQAQVFIHFTSVGISRLILGALLVAAQRVNVRGVVSNIDESMQAEFKQLNQEASGMWIKGFGKDSTWREMPHQKLVVIDGLLAFKGSANFIRIGMAKSSTTP
jgi:phosphatidylserine/phosphatidylglycerophosphate/cardiolipin synthase-like enzyme